MTTICGSLSIPAIFGDYMVLRRNVPIKVWGKSDTPVTITFNDETVVTEPEKGLFLATLSPLPASGPYTMTIESGSDTIVFNDIMIGEVWLCSGQSNMEWQLSLSQNGPVDAENAKDDYLRLFTVAHIATYEPVEDVVGCWEKANETSVLDFSAVGYYFGKKLREELNVTIGLIDSSWGGTIIEAWTSKKAMESNPLLVDIVNSYEDYISSIGDPKKAYAAIMDDWKKSTAFSTNSVDISNLGHSKGYASLGFNDTNLPSMDLPHNWFEGGITHHGVVWFRKTNNIPEHLAGKDLILNLTPIDKSDVTYFNNAQVGSMRIEDNTNAWATPRRYLIPKELVTAGEAVIAVRVFSNIYGAGFVNGKKEDMYIIEANGDIDERIDLGGDWKYIIEQDFGYNASFPEMPKSPPGENNPNTPYALSRAMIDPLTPFAISGAIWYQGESNAESKEKAISYRLQLPVMIADWRNKFEVGDFPFYIVQLANFNANQVDDQFYNWGLLRESQVLTTQSVKNCDMATIIDVGDSVDIHPTNKHDVGLRLAYLALYHDYDLKELRYHSPRYKSMEVIGDEVHISFDHVYDRLVSSGNEITGFKIAGEAREFIDAKVRIAGDEIILSNENISNPLAVRYAFEADPVCNLFNSEGLPVEPFRTDKWEI